MCVYKRHTSVYMREDTLTHFLISVFLSLVPFRSPLVFPPIRVEIVKRQLTQLT